MHVATGTAGMHSQHLQTGGGSNDEHRGYMCPGVQGYVNKSGSGASSGLLMQRDNMFDSVGAKDWVFQHDMHMTHVAAMGML